MCEKRKMVISILVILSRELPDAVKWKIVSTVDGVHQQKHVFDWGVFACMFADFIYHGRPPSFRPNDITNQECRKIIAFSI